MDNKNTVYNSGKEKKGYNILPKIICLVAAIILWLYVSEVEATDYESTFKGVAVELANTSALDGRGMAIYSGTGNLVDVTVTGKRSVINKYSSEDIRVYADVSRIEKSGRHTVSVTAELPQGLQLSSVSQSSVNVYVDETVTYEVNVETRYGTSVVPQGYSLGTPLPEFSTVSVTGPRTVLDTLDCAELVLDLGEVSTTLTVTQNVVLKDKLGNTISNQYVRLGRSSIKVTVPVYTEKTVPLLVDFKHGYFTDANSTVTVSPETVTLKGDPTVLSGYDSIKVATIDETALVEDYTESYILNLPEGVISSDNVTNVDVSVEHKGTEVRSFTLDSDDVLVTGAAGKDYEIVSDKITVMVRGVSGRLNGLDADDITVTVDLSRYEDVSGRTDIKADVTVSGMGLSLYPVGSCTVSIEIK